MNGADHDLLARLLKERSGIVLHKDRSYLVESRLTPLVRQLGLASLAELSVRLRQGDAALAGKVVDAMTTNETFFFRDKTPFERFAAIMLPHLLAARQAARRIRIWCAAASTGQEPYSLAMLLDDRRAELAGWRVEIVATDLSPTVIERARAGCYSQFEVQRGLPIQRLVRHFRQKGDRWEISPELRRMVRFRTQNLLRDFSALGAFDVVFCRNVLIYFDEATRTDILARIAGQIAGDGFLTLGAAETVVGLGDAFRPHPDSRGIYVPGPAPATATMPRRAAG